MVREKVEQIIARDKEREEHNLRANLASRLLGPEPA